VRASAIAAAVSKMRRGQALGFAPNRNPSPFKADCAAGCRFIACVDVSTPPPSPVVRIHQSTIVRAISCAILRRILRRKARGWDRCRSGFALQLLRRAAKVAFVGRVPEKPMALAESLYDG